MVKYRFTMCCIIGIINYINEWNVSPIMSDTTANQGKNITGLKTTEDGDLVLQYRSGHKLYLVWLKEQGYVVLCYLAKLGQEEDYKATEKKAMKLGDKKCVLPDLRKELVKDYIHPAIQANAFYEDRYNMLGTALVMPCISKSMVKLANDENAKYISHGATRKGNDQIQFGLACYALLPEV